MANQGPAPEGGVSGLCGGLADGMQGSRRSMEGTCDESLQLCADSLEDRGGVGIIQPIFSDPVYVKEYSGLHHRWLPSWDR